MLWHVECCLWSSKTELCFYLGARRCLGLGLICLVGSLKCAESSSLSLLVREVTWAVADVVFFLVFLSELNFLFPVAQWRLQA